MMAQLLHLEVEAAQFQDEIVEEVGVEAVEVGLAREGRDHRARTRAGAAAGGFEREAHHDVGASQHVAGKPGAATQFGLQEVKLASQVGAHHQVHHGLADTPSNRAN